MKMLNDTQLKDIKKVLGYYKFYYICNSCGSIYGSDKKDTKQLCPACDMGMKYPKSKRWVIEGEF